jgi:hypothetical protein
VCMCSADTFAASAHAALMMLHCVRRLALPLWHLCHAILIRLMAASFLPQALFEMTCRHQVLRLPLGPAQDALP